MDNQLKRGLLDVSVLAAIKNEDYEKAAFYRDYLKAIEKKSVAAESDDKND